MSTYNSETILQCVDNLVRARNSQEVLMRLQLSLLPLSLVERISVWTEQKKNHWVLLASDEQKPQHQQFTFDRSVLPQLVTNIEDINQELPKGSLPAPLADERPLVLKVDFAETHGMFFLHLAKGSVVGKTSLRTLRQLLPLFRQAFLTLQQEYQTQFEVAHRTSALSASQNRLKTFAELASDWLWELDEDFRYFYLSATEHSAQHERYQHFIGKTPLEVRSDEEKSNLKKWGHWLHMTNKRQVLHDFEYEALDAQGRPFWISISGKPQYDENGHFYGYIGTGRDITFSKQREAALTQEREKAERASAAKSNFLAVMSHEIRTPMNAILGMLELFEDTQPTEKQQELIEFMRSSAKLLQGVISDTLDFAKIESGKLVLHPSTINLHLLLKNLVKQFETQALKQGLDFNFEMAKRVPELVICDGLRLSQVLLNLLGNAFKFTHKGSVNLHVSRNDSQLIFRVKDTGVGIPPRKISSLFEPFTQLKGNTQARQQGVGLGLSITKRLLTLMQGNIDCHSEVGEFSEFIVSIPLEEVENVEAHNNSTGIDVDSSVSGYRILVAEDNVANQFVIQAILEKRNHQVTLVENGELAVQATDNQSFDLVLMDMMMPVMDGVEAARRIREKFTSTELPIIALTANAGITDRAKCFQSGMNEVITKPLDSQLLEQKIQQFGHR